MTQRMGELLVMHRVGRNHIERTAQIVIQQPQNAVNHIVDMDPGQVLSAIADRPAEAELKGGCHFAENTAPRGARYHAGAQRADAGALALRFAGNLLPAGARSLWVNSLCGGSSSVTTTSPEVAIVADGRPADQHTEGRGVAGVDQGPPAAA